MSISIKFPFQESYEGGIFKFNRTTTEKVRTNLIALLTMKRRQRPMHNTLYSPLYDVIFEQWDEISSERLKSALLNQIASFIPEITTEDIIFTFDEDTHVLTTKIVYSIIEMAGATDFVEIDVKIQPTD